MRHDEAKAFGTGVGVDGIAPTFADTRQAALQQGSDAVIPRLGSLRRDRHEGVRRRPRACGSAAPLTRHHLGRPHRWRSGSPRSPTRRRDLTGDVLISQAAFDASFPRPSDLFVFVRTARRRRTRRPRPGIDRAVARFTEVDARTRGGLDRLPRQGHAAVPHAALRPARAVGRRQPVRDGQRARAHGLRAHPRDRDDARRRHDPPPGAPHGAPREHHHRAHRRRARAAARAAGGRRRWRARCTRPFVPPVRVAGDLHARRDPRRRAGGDRRRRAGRRG